MSAKDTFFKKVEENVDAQKASEMAIQRDIMEFQRETEVLLHTIRTWFEGTPVKSKISLDHHMMEGKRVEFESLTLANGNNHLTITPEGLYYFGITGVLNVTIDNPNRAPRQTKFSIHWKDAMSKISGWVIVDNVVPANRVEFNQENFFSRITAFA